MKNAKRIASTIGFTVIRVRLQSTNLLYTRYSPFHPGSCATCELTSIRTSTVSQGWGKNQTYILAFSDESADRNAFALTSARLQKVKKECYVPLPRQYLGVESYHGGPIETINSSKLDSIAVVDVTGSYTDNVDRAHSRREVKGEEFSRALERLRNKMKDIPST